MAIDSIWGWTIYEKVIEGKRWLCLDGRDFASRFHFPISRIRMLVWDEHEKDRCFVYVEDWDTPFMIPRESVPSDLQPGRMK